MKKSTRKGNARMPKHPAGQLSSGRTTPPARAVSPGRTTPSAHEVSSGRATPTAHEVSSGRATPTAREVSSGRTTARPTPTQPYFPSLPIVRRRFPGGRVPVPPAVNAIASVPPSTRIIRMEHFATLQIIPDFPGRMHPTANWISGHVVITAKRYLSARERLVITLEGSTRVQFENCEKTVVHVSERRDVIVSDMEPDEVHTADFFFFLNKSLPSSFIGQWGKTSYQIRAVLQDRQSINRADTCEPLTVIQAIDLNMDSTAAKPLKGRQEPQKRSLSPPMLEISAGIAKRGYIHNEKIYIDARFQTSIAAARPFKLSAELMQVVVYQANAVTQNPKKLGKPAEKIVRTPLAKFSESRHLQPHVPYDWNGLQLQIPDCAIPSRHDDAIEVYHEITIKMHVGLSALGGLAYLQPLKIGWRPVTASNPGTVSSGLD